MTSGRAAAALQPFRDRVTFIPFGIDVDAWRPTEEVGRRAEEIRQRVGRPIVLFAGRHVPYKGVAVLVEAAAPLDVAVVIAGNGPMRSSWEELSRHQTGPAIFSFSGETDELELRALLLASDMLVLPSVTRAEAFGYVQLAGDGVRYAGDQHGAPYGRALGERIGACRAGERRAGTARGNRQARSRSRPGSAARPAWPGARPHRVLDLSTMSDRLVAVCQELAGVGR